MGTADRPDALDRISIVVPVFNEVSVIRQSWERLRQLPGLVDREIEIVLVDDGSTDGTTEILESIASASWPGITVRLQIFSRNFGHSAAVLAGLQVATGDPVAILDADLQDPPELLPQMLSVLRSGDCDVVYGKRIRRAGESLFKRATAWAFYRLWNRLVGVVIPADTGDFRVMTRQVCTAVLRCGENDPFLRGLVSWVGFRQKPFPYVRDPRTSGRTKYTLGRMLDFAGMAVISFSTRPLRLALYLGLLGLFAGLLLGGWACWCWIIGSTVRGWASLLAGLSLVQSFTLLLVGIQGLYIARIHEEAKDRPRFIVRKDSAGHTESTG